MIDPPRKPNARNERREDKNPTHFRNLKPSVRTEFEGQIIKNTNEENLTTHRNLENKEVCIQSLKEKPNQVTPKNKKEENKENKKEENKKQIFSKNDPKNPYFGVYRKD